MVCDDLPHLRNNIELSLLGQLVDSEERWEFYNALNFERPSNMELTDVKGVIIGYSSHRIKNKVPKDLSFLKAMTKKVENDDKSEGARESSNGSVNDGTDLDMLQRQVKHIVGEDMIPQNDEWIEKLALFIKDIYKNHPHIKLFGSQFGS